MGDVKEIKSIPVVPFALMIGAISVVIGFLYALIFILPMSLLIGTIPTQGMEGMQFVGLGAGFGILMLIVMPIVAFIAGFIAYAIIALVYNVLAPRIGGIKLELE